MLGPEFWDHYDKMEAAHDQNETDLEESKNEVTELTAQATTSTLISRVLIDIGLKVNSSPPPSLGRPAQSRVESV